MKYLLTMNAVMEEKVADVQEHTDRKESWPKGWMSIRRPRSGLVRSLWDWNGSGSAERTAVWSGPAPPGIGSDLDRRSVGSGVRPWTVGSHLTFR